MRAQFTLFIILLCGSTVVAQQAVPAQPPPDCNAPEHRQFDFWVGEWNVTTPQGQPAGTNRIERTLEGCALMEDWTSAGGTSGSSFNFYDRATGQWYQSWIDERGGALRMSGGLVEGKMVLQTEPLRRRDGVTVVHRVSWSREDGQRVRQFWESTTDGGKTWIVAFDGMYERKQ